MGFSKLFWAFLFYLDFRVFGLDLLPNLVGHLLMYSGLMQLLDVNEHFEKAAKYVFPLALLSLGYIYQPQPSTSGFVAPSLLAVLAGILYAIINLLLVNEICLGVGELADGQLADLARQRWNIYVAVTLVTLFLPYIEMVVPLLMAVLFLPVFVASVASVLLLMGLMKQAQQLQGS